MKIFILSKRLLYLIFIFLILITLFLVYINHYRIKDTIRYYDPYYKGNTNENKIAFACNVVWGNEYLEQILKILNDNNIKITFFVGGAWADKNENMLLKLKENKHEIGSHGYKHIQYSNLRKEQIKEDIQKAEDSIKRITGDSTKLLSPPYGDVNKSISAIGEELGYKVIMWSIDTIDWNTKDFNMILSRVDKKHHPGAIILMHPTESTVKALPKMIQSLEEKGYSIVTVGEIIK